MTRRLLNLLTALSLMLCVAAGVLWARSYWHRTWFSVSRERLDDRGYLSAIDHIVSGKGAVALRSSSVEDDGRQPRSLGYVPRKGPAFNVWTRKRG